MPPQIKVSRQIRYIQMHVGLIFVIGLVAATEASSSGWNISDYLGDNAIVKLAAMFFGDDFLAESVYVILLLALHVLILTFRLRKYCVAVASQIECAKCGYDLRSGEDCPECGHRFRLDS